MGINGGRSSSGDVCADKPGLFAQPSSDNGEPLSASPNESHAERGATDVILHHFISTECRHNVCVCVSACVCVSFQASGHTVVCMCVRRRWFGGSACCSSQYLEADLICSSAAAPDTWKSHYSVLSAWGGSVQLQTVLASSSKGPFLAQKLLFLLNLGAFPITGGYMGINVPNESFDFLKMR